MNAFRLPPYLQKGNNIGITCPGGFMSLEKLRNCIAQLGDWGFGVKLGKTIGGDSSDYFSGTDEQRLNDLQQMLDDEDIKAILFGRGGYGMSRIIDRLDFTRFLENPKWIAGYSDITLLHAHLHANYGLCSLHSPMGGAFNDLLLPNPYTGSLLTALKGESMEYDFATHPYNRSGDAEGILIGGNLSLLAHAIGTPSDIDTRDRILFIEDVGELLYQVDRLLHQLKRSGKFEGLKGLLVGSFSDMKDTERPFGKNIYEIVEELARPYDFPVAFDFPVGHVRENYAYKLGVPHSLVITPSKVKLKEMS